MRWVSAQMVLEVGVVGELLLADVAEERKRSLMNGADVHSQCVLAKEAPLTQRAGVASGANVAALSVCCCIADGGVVYNNT